MEKLLSVRSRTVVMPQADIDTDQIVPARFLTTTTRKGLGAAILIEWLGRVIFLIEAAITCKQVIGGDMNQRDISARNGTGYIPGDHGVRMICEITVCLATIHVGQSCRVNHQIR